MSRSSTRIARGRSGSLSLAAESQGQPRRAGPIIVTGGAGLIGSALVRTLVRAGTRRVVTVDNLAHASNLESLEETLHAPTHRFVQADVGDAHAMREVLEETQPEAVIHLAAETHVDRAIDEPAGLIETNVGGTFTLLQETMRYWKKLPQDRARDFRFVHASTDEVFGTLGSHGFFTESSAYAPRSPYAASKAAADHLVRAYFHTYGLPVVITHSPNNLGPYQFPDNLVPMVTLRALAGETIPINGDGRHVRDWLFVDDHATALIAALERGQAGESYAFGARAERTNLWIAERICTLLDSLTPHPDIRDRRSLIRLVPDRAGQDRRHAIDPHRAGRDLQWRPRITLDSALRRTVAWYVAHTDWCERIHSDQYDGARLGLSRSA